MSFSFAKAQNRAVGVVNPEPSVASCVKAMPVKVFKSVYKQLDVKPQQHIDSKLKAIGFSDIRLFFNRERKIDNLSLLFPKVYKEAKV